MAKANTKMTRAQMGYPKCATCVASNDFSQKPVFVSKDAKTKKYVAKCAKHGGSGKKPFDPVATALKKAALL
jgi:hypothetical protein